MPENTDNLPMELIFRGLALAIAPYLTDIIGHSQPQGPRSLNERESHEYLGIGRTKFRELLKTGQIPQAFKCGGTNHWLREWLDNYLDQTSGKQPNHVQRLPKSKRPS